MDITRRRFLNYVKGAAWVTAGVASLGILGAMVVYTGPTTDWEKKIDQLRINAGPDKDGAKYLDRGFIYDIEVDGELVRANLSPGIPFLWRDEDLQYTKGNISYCVSVDGCWDSVTAEHSNGEKITDPNIAKEAKTLTDRVLAALVSKQEELITKRNKPANQELQYK